jgi:hypothetical protein
MPTNSQLYNSAEVHATNAQINLVHVNSNSKTSAAVATTIAVLHSGCQQLGE